MKATTSKKSMTMPKHGLSSTLESYLEQIHELQNKYGAVRVTDLAKGMGCAMPTATNALRRLAKLNLIKYEAHRPVTLTKLGESTIRRLDLRHHVLADFFSNVLALPTEIAEEEACRLEHRISHAVVSRLAEFMEYIHNLEGGASLLRQQCEFSKFREKKRGSKNQQDITEND